MALTAFQRTVCQLLAHARKASGESYVAGEAALNELLDAPRQSRVLDLLPDSERAVQASWDADRALLDSKGYRVRVLRERPSFVEAEVASGAYSVVLEWLRDSAFRFFPLVEHAELGLVLHPFDLATNKVLALVGRVEARDWVDIIECNERLQPLGYLAWAACGKDPGFSPRAILEQASRSSRYSAEEIQHLAFDGPSPDAAQLSQRFRQALEAGHRIVGALPAEKAGECVLDDAGNLFRGGPDDAVAASANGMLRFHRGSIRGALPQLQTM